jgi:hypothetical protein
MSLRRVRVSEPGQSSRRNTLSQERGIPISQDDPADAVEATEEMQDNPWAGESGDDRSTAALRDRHHSNARPRTKSTVPTHEANAWPFRRQGTTQSREKKPTRSRRQTSWDTDSYITNTSDSSSENASSDSDVGRRHTESPGRDLERKIQRLQRRLASLQHSDSNPGDGRVTSTSQTCLFNPCRSYRANVASN